MQELVLKYQERREDVPISREESYGVAGELSDITYEGGEEAYVGDTVLLFYEGVFIGNSLVCKKGETFLVFGVGGVSFKEGQGESIHYPVNDRKYTIRKEKSFTELNRSFAIQGDYWSLTVRI